MTALLSDPVEVVARTLWGEARGCGAAGMRHVANVVINRAAHPSWWGHDLVSVCLHPWQFSCWNADDPNRAKLLAVTAADRDYALALVIARQAVAGALPDATAGADSYYARSMRTPPAWAATAVRTFTDGWHAFYRTVPAAAETAADARNVSLHAAAPAAGTTAALNAADLAALSGGG